MHDLQSRMAQIIHEQGEQSGGIIFLVDLNFFGCKGFAENDMAGEFLFLV